MLFTKQMVITNQRSYVKHIALGLYIDLYQELETLLRCWGIHTRSYIHIPTILYYNSTLSHAAVSSNSGLCLCLEKINSWFLNPKVKLYEVKLIFALFMYEVQSYLNSMAYQYCLYSLF